MKQTKIVHIFACFAAIALLAACKKKQDVVYDKEIKSFIFTAALNKGLVADVPCDINGNDITVHMSNAADVKNLIPVFQLENARTIVKAQGKVQESGITAVDFTNPVDYTVKSEDKATKTFRINVIRNSGIRKFAFYTEDNKGVLFKDNYEAIFTGLNISIKVPVGTDVTNLIARFETSNGAEVKVKGAVQQSAKTSQDYTQPVTFEVLDAATGTSDKFIVTVGFLTDPQWLLITDKLVRSRTNSLKMALSPTTGFPYLSFYRTNLSEDSTDLATTDRKVVVMSYNGQNWNYLGDPAGVTEGQVSDSYIATDKDGVPYISYIDYANAQKISVKKYVNGTWNFVGAPGFTIAKPTYPSFAIDGTNTPYISFSDNAGSVAGVARGVYTMFFNGSAWVPAPLSTPTAVFYTSLTDAGGKVYLGIMDRSTGGNRPSLMTRENNAWKYVGPASFTTNGVVGIQNVAAAVAPDGTPYVIYQESTGGGRANHVMQLKNNVWSEIGTATLVQSESVFAMAVHPNGRLFVAYSDGTNACVKYFDTKINNWSPVVKLGATKPYELDIKITPQGIPYLAISYSASTKPQDKTSVYKYDIP